MSRLPLLPLVAVATCGAAGFFGARALIPPAPILAPSGNGHAAESAPVKNAPAPAAPLAPGTVIAEWEELRAQHGSSAEEMPALFAAVQDIKDSFRRRAFRAALLAEWAALDPMGGILSLSSSVNQKDRSSATHVLREWMRLDPERAVTQMLAGGEKTLSTLLSALEDVARLAPARLAEVASKYSGQSRSGNGTTENAFAILAKNDPAAARMAAESVTGPLKRDALAGVAKAWAETDGPAALAWTQEMPKGEARDAAMKAVLVGWAKSDPLAALSKIDLVPPGGQENYYGSDVGAQVLREAAAKDWDGTMRWLQEHPGKLGQQSMQGLMGAVSKRLNEDPIAALQSLQKSGLPGMQNVLSNSLLNEGYGKRDAVMKWLDDQPPSDFTNAARGALINAMVWKEPETALAFLEKLPDSPENRGLLEQGARGLLNGGMGMNRFEELLGRASAKLRPLLLESGLMFGLERSGGDPTKWLARLEELPAESRGNAVASLARSWAVNDPEGAAGWALSLTDPQQRSAALTSAAGAWIQADRFEAAEWINTLPAGADRDTAAHTLVGAMASTDPQGAWTWALSIQTPEHRQNAIQLAYMLIQKNDPALARQMVRDSKLPPAESKALLLREGSFPGADVIFNQFDRFGR